MSWMFGEAVVVQSDIGGWNVEKGVDMEYLFPPRPSTRIPRQLEPRQRHECTRDVQLRLGLRPGPRLVRGRRRGPGRRVLQHPVRVDCVRRGPRRLHAPGRDSCADAHADASAGACTDAHADDRRADVLDAGAVRGAAGRLRPRHVRPRPRHVRQLRAERGLHGGGARAEGRLRTRQRRAGRGVLLRVRPQRLHAQPDGLADPGAHRAPDGPALGAAHGREADAQPASDPTRTPTTVPSSMPTTTPTSGPTKVPTSAPTSVPTSYPSEAPSPAPSKVPTGVPTEQDPTPVPTGAHRPGGADVRPDPDADVAAVVGALKDPE